MKCGDAIIIHHRPKRTDRNLVCYSGSLRATLVGGFLMATQRPVYVAISAPAYSCRVPGPLRVSTSRVGANGCGPDEYVSDDAPGEWLVSQTEFGTPAA